MSAWAEWCYRSPSRLLYSETVIQSAAGVQQGDNLGPLLFSLAVQPVSEQIRSISGIDLVTAYLDDVVCAGEADAILAALQTLQAAAPSPGLELNLAKCDLIPTAGEAATVGWGVFPAEIRRVMSGNFKSLGSPIGDRDHCARFVRDKRVARAVAMLNVVPELEDAQAAHKLLMHCLGSCRIMHTMRTTRPDWILDE